MFFCVVCACSLQEKLVRERAEVGLKAGLHVCRMLYASSESSNTDAGTDRVRDSSMVLFRFLACLNAYFHCSLSFLLLSDASSHELLCPNTQSPSVLVQWAASQQSLGAIHFPVPPGPGILK